MGRLRRLVITGLLQLLAFVLLLYYAVVFVGSYYVRLALVTAALVDAATSVRYLISSMRQRGEERLETEQP